MTWWEGYLAQARSDFAVYRQLNALPQGSPVGKHDQLHYLQMACEKLAKAALAWSGTPIERLRQTHAAFTDLLDVLKLQRPVGRFAEAPRAQWKAHLVAAKPVARIIEQLAPAEAKGGPNAEYPWEMGGTVIAPCDYAWPFSPASDRGWVKVINLVDDLLRDFELYFRPKRRG